MLRDNSNLFFNNNTLSTDSVSLGTNIGGKLKVEDVWNQYQAERFNDYERNRDRWEYTV